ncbi:leucine-rich repeat domain-containing protein [Ruminococcaceae bacterium OttesenSCG-928-L11]|nr:leucine-rich repeat domain-containing protein [Ruminococcaceae bacterium OttesenSCG-928-L11]
MDNPLESNGMPNEASVDYLSSEPPVSPVLTEEEFMGPLPDSDTTITQILPSTPPDSDPEPAEPQKPAKGKKGKKKPGKPKKKKSGKSLGETIKGVLFKYKISIRKNEDTAEADASQPEETPAEDTPAPKAKKEKAPKPKKPAPKKKKPAAKKKPKPKPKKPAKDGEEGEKKGKLGLILGIAGGAVAVGGGILAAVLIMGGSGPTPQEILEQAAVYYSEANYADAGEAYMQLLDDQENLDTEILVEAYLGLSDVQMMEDVDTGLETAIATLETGYAYTEDPRIQERIDSLTPEEEPEEPPEDEAIVFVDEAFERMVRMALNIPAPQPIRRADTLQVKSLKIVGGTHAVSNNSLNARNSTQGYTIDDVLYTERGAITSLQDVANFPNLTKLVVCYNQISDISGIENLTKLDTLGLYFNEISDLTPLSTLPSLKFLYLYNNHISSLEPVANLNTLEELWVQNNDITDLTPVQSLQRLRELVVKDNSISDISAIKGLPDLAFFHADNNRISDISAIADTPSLTDVSLVNNPIVDMSPAANVKNVNRFPY